MAVVSFKYPNCDGELVFHPKTQKYKCGYCASAFSQEELGQLLPIQGRPSQSCSGPKPRTVQADCATGQQRNHPFPERSSSGGSRKF